MNQTIFLDVIIPFRYSPLRDNCLINLETVLSEFTYQDARFILVDSGSDAEASSKAKDICIKYGALYSYINTANETFSIGKARNHGAEISTAKYILFQDIDLLPYANFYKDLEILINERFSDGIDEVINIPCIYLSDSASKEYISNTPENRKIYLQDSMKTGDERIEFYAASSSVAVFDRYYYCALGGHDPRFQGHGCEDFELFYRAYSNNPRFPRPSNIYSNDGHWNTQSYSGFRSWYRKYGDETALDGIFIAHLWHEREKESSDYIRKSKENKNLLKQCMLEHDNQCSCWLPPIPYNEKRTLFLGVEGSEFTESIREVIPSLGHVDYQRESFFETETELKEHISKKKIDQVFFHNPYANKQRLNIYRYCRNEEIPYIVYERGALPGAVFFDMNGFNTDSTSYHEKNWDRELSDTEILSVTEYCKNEIQQGGYLEKQPKKMGSEYIKNKYRINGKKICLVPLQRPTDTVCEIFKGPLREYSDFYAWVDIVSKSLKEWVFLIKTHPLEKNPTYPFEDNHNVINCDLENIYDLIDAADSVFLLNSGVGLLSILRFKNVVSVGDAFYYHKGICSKAETPEEAAALISREWEPDRNRVYKFLNYLINEFYSFGQSSTKSVNRNGDEITITTKVKFGIIRIPGQGIQEKFNSRTLPLFSKKSYLLGVKFSQVDIPHNTKKTTLHTSSHFMLRVKRAIKLLIWKSIGSNNGVELISGIYRLLGIKKIASKDI
ncbi:glycosyltransferase [Microbulbifer variabilis]|uniref:Glycosyltransferase n=1 Tax=Microbulbifer variabilis TaxID=266805 RepID=A0ABY4V917_9GAMM|nr:glycosyltransferase [Microbulbifer variabilis]USD19896.1 glycosyltransferase [Microbulbifer variabilis]